MQNVVVCTVQCIENYQLGQHLLMDHCIEEAYFIVLQSPCYIQHTLET